MGSSNHGGHGMLNFTPCGENYLYWPSVFMESQIFATFIVCWPTDNIVQWLLFCNYTSQKRSCLIQKMCPDYEAPHSLSKLCRRKPHLLWKYNDTFQVAFRLRLFFLILVGHCKIWFTDAQLQGQGLSCAVFGYSTLRETDNKIKKVFSGAVLLIDNTVVPDRVCQNKCQHLSDSFERCFELISSSYFEACWCRESIHQL